MNQLMFDWMSRLPSPWRPSSCTKFSTQACWAQVWNP